MTRDSRAKNSDDVERAFTYLFNAYTRGRIDRVTGSTFEVGQDVFDAFMNGRPASQPQFVTGIGTKMIVTGPGWFIRLVGKS